MLEVLKDELHYNPQLAVQSSSASSSLVARWARPCPPQLLPYLTPEIQQGNLNEEVLFSLQRCSTSLSSSSRALMMHTVSSSLYVSCVASRRPPCASRLSVVRASALSCQQWCWRRSSCRWCWSWAQGDWHTPRVSACGMLPLAVALSIRVHAAAPPRPRRPAPCEQHAPCRSCRRPGRVRHRFDAEHAAATSGLLAASPPHRPAPRVLVLPSTLPSMFTAAVATTTSGKATAVAAAAAAATTGKWISHSWRRPARGQSRCGCTGCRASSVQRRWRAPRRSTRSVRGWRLANGRQRHSQQCRESRRCAAAEPTSKHGAAKRRGVDE